MMDKNDILKRYYRGETSIREERLLKEEFGQGNLPHEPALAYQGEKEEFPEMLLEQIQEKIQRRKSRENHRIWYCAGGIAAALVMIISIKTFLPSAPDQETVLADHVKQERFEDALRIIGDALQEKNTEEKILYEDNNIIIALE